MGTSKRDMFFNHKIQKIAEKLKEEEKKEEKEVADETPIVSAIGGPISPVKIARAAESLKDDPESPLKKKVTPPPPVQELPKGWDLSSLKTDGPIE